MKHQECVLNVRYDLPNEMWVKIVLVYEKLPGWIGFGKVGKGEEGIPYWFSFNEEEKSITASVEPSGLLITGNIEEKQWVTWISKFKKRLSEIIGFDVIEI